MGKILTAAGTATAEAAAETLSPMSRKEISSVDDSSLDSPSETFISDTPVFKDFFGADDSPPTRWISKYYLSTTKAKSLR